MLRGHIKLMMVKHNEAESTCYTLDSFNDGCHIFCMKLVHHITCWIHYQVHLLRTTNLQQFNQRSRADVVSIVEVVCIVHPSMLRSSGQRSVVFCSGLIVRQFSKFHPPSHAGPVCSHSVMVHITCFHAEDPGSIPGRGSGLFRYITHNTTREGDYITRPSPITGNDWPLTSHRNIADERYNAVQTTSTIDAKAVRYVSRHFMRFRAMRVNTPTCAIYDTYTSIMWWPQFQHRM